MTAAAAPIGEVSCPHKGCDERCKVYAFRPRTEGRKSVFTGKKYLVCAVHGRIGADGAQAVTDYILEKGTIWGATRPAPEKPAENPAARTRGTAQKPHSTPERRPASSPKNPEPTPHKPKWWEPQW